MKPTITTLLALFTTTAVAAPTNETRTLTTYPPTCNTDHAAYWPMIYCYQTLYAKGSTPCRKHTTGPATSTSGRFCEAEGTRVSGSVWEGGVGAAAEADCRDVAEALKGVWERCGERGGSQEVQGSRGRGKLIVHLGTHWV